MAFSLLNNAVYEKTKIRLASKWDIRDHHWYPLNSCNIKDVIAFDLLYLEGHEKLETIKKLIKEHGTKIIYEFREDGTYGIILDYYDYQFWNSELYFWNNECYWFDDNMDWIIYISHEETITFGGEWLIKELKKTWTDWKYNIAWDTGN